MALRIACIGDNCIDRYLPQVGLALVGGNAVNVAVQLARLGHEAHYFGAVGADAEGAQVRSELERNGVNMDGVTVDAERPTAFTEIETQDGGERRFVREEFGACAAYRPDEAAAAKLAEFDHVHFGWMNDGGSVKRRLLVAGQSVSQDLSVNSRPENLGPRGLPVAFASAAEADAEARACGLLEAGARLAVVTMGESGSLAMSGHDFFRQQALPVKPVDTTGAGDAFIAGFLSAYLLSRGIPAALAEAASLARQACLHAGGFPQAPRL